MCVSPILLKNPNKGADPNMKLNYLKNCTDSFIYIPCGHCPECIAVKQMGLVQRIQMESLKNHVFFNTLTYNNESLPRLTVYGHDDFGTVTDEYSISYADINDVVNMVRLIRKDKVFPRYLRYFAVSELGSKRGRPHFHILWLVPKEKDDDFNTCLNLEHQLYNIVFKYWRRNYGSRKYPDWRPLFDYHERFTASGLKKNFDLHYVNPALSDNGESDVGFYVLKYMLKPSVRAERLQQALHMNLDLDEYDKVWNKVRPRYFKSLDFGLKKDPDIQAHLRKGIQFGKPKFDYPVFVNPTTGQTFPLSRFYKSCGDIYTLQDATDFYFNKKSDNIDSSDLYDLRDYKRSYEKFNQRLALVQMHDDKDNF